MRGTTSKAIAVLTLFTLLAFSNLQWVVKAKASSKPPAENGKACSTCGKGSQGDDLQIETRKGEAVVLRAKQLKARNRHVARAMKDMERRGLRPAFEAGASILAVSKSGKFRKTAAQDTIVEGDVELTFFSYDDGNPNTWEGLMYYRSPQGERMDYVVIDISTSSPYVTHEQNYYTLNSQPVDHTLGSLKGDSPAKNRAGRSTRSKSTSKVLSAHAVRPQAEQITNFVICAVTGCAIAIGNCISQGPHFIQCFIYHCSAALTSCAMDHLRVG